MTRCQQLLMDGTREPAGRMAKAGGDQALLPAAPSALLQGWALGQTHRQGPTGPSYGATTFPQCHHGSTTKAGAWLSKAPHSRKCQWWQCWGCWSTEATESGKPLVSPLRSQVPPGAIPAVRCVCLGRGTRSNQMVGLINCPGKAN